MHDILDDLKGKAEQKDLSTQMYTKAALYIGIMVLGEIIFYFLLGRSIFPIYLTVGLSICYALSLSLILEFIRYGLHKWKEKRKDIIIKRDPFWFQVVEGAFSIWLLFLVVTLFQQLFFIVL